MGSHDSSSLGETKLIATKNDYLILPDKLLLFFQ
jgi:hypothetical protein